MEYRGSLWNSGDVAQRRNGGYRTFIGMDLRHQRGVIVLSNSTDLADDIGFHLLVPQIPLVGAPRNPDR
jgi:hypothetical protein